MSIALLFCGLAVLVQQTLGLLVIYRDFRKTANLVFSLQLFLFMLWGLAEINQIIRGVDALSIKLLMTPGILLCYFFCIFSAIYPEYQKNCLILRSRFHQLLFFAPAAFLLWLLWSDQLITEFSAISNGFTIHLGKFEFLAKGFIVGYLLFSLSTLSNSRKNAETPIQIRRLRYTFTAMLLPVAAGSIVIAAGKWIIGGNTAYTFGLFPLLGIIMSTLLGYTMLKYNLMEIDLMFSIGLVYTLLTAILAGFMELMQELMQDMLSISDFWTKLISVLIIAAIFSPLKDLLIKLVDHFFGRRSFDSAQVMQHILAEMRKCRTIEEMMQRLSQELHPVIDFSFCRIDLEGVPARSFGTVFSEPGKIELKMQDIPHEIQDVETALDFFRNDGNKENAKAMESLKENGVRNFFAIGDRQKSYGFLLLGAKSSKVPYAEAEINLVRGLCHEFPFLIENLRMLEQLLSRDRDLREIQLARKMLAAITADKNEIKLGKLCFAVYSSLSGKIKGDLIDFNDAGPESFVGIYDAFHHGIKAVLTLNLIFSVFRSELNPAQKFATANKVLQHFKDQQLCSAATIVAGNNEVIEIYCAGNPSPLLIGNNICQPLFTSKTNPLGLHDTVEFAQQSLSLQKQQMLLLSTNGLFKAFDQKVKMPLNDFLAQQTFASPPECLRIIVSKLEQNLDSSFSDDITFLIAGYDL